MPEQEPDFFKEKTEKEKTLPQFDKNDAQITPKEIEENKKKKEEDPDWWREQP